MGGLWANRPGDRHGVDTAHRMGQGHEPFLSIDEQALGARFPFSANQLGIFQMQETVGVASLSGEGKPVLTAIAPPACLNDGVSSSAFTIPPAPPNFPSMEIGSSKTSSSSTFVLLHAAWDGGLWAAPHFARPNDNPGFWHHIDIADG